MGSWSSFSTSSRSFPHPIHPNPPTSSFSLFRNLTGKQLNFYPTDSMKFYLKKNHYIQKWAKLKYNWSPAQSLVIMIVILITNSAFGLTFALESKLRMHLLLEVEEIPLRGQLETRAANWLNKSYSYWGFFFILNRFGYYSQERGSTGLGGVTNTGFWRSYAPLQIIQLKGLLKIFIKC